MNDFYFAVLLLKSSHAPKATAQRLRNCEMVKGPTIMRGSLRSVSVKKRIKA